MDLYIYNFSICTFTIFYQVTSHSNYVIYLLEWGMCKIPYFGKPATFNIRLNNHRKDKNKCHRRM